MTFGGQTRRELIGPEEGRLAAVARTGLSPAADATFDRYAQLIRNVLDVPVALVSMVDNVRQFFPGLAGLGGEAGAARETPLSHSFCKVVVDTGAPLVVTDSRLDSRVAGNGAIVDLGVTAYAGVPLRDGSGLVVGSLCAIDSSSREWTARELAILADLAHSCEMELQLREARSEAVASREFAEAAAGRLAVLSEVSRALSSTLDSAETLARLLRLLVPRLADWAIVSEVDPSGNLGAAAGRHRDPTLASAVEEVAMQQPMLVTEASLVARVARTGEPVLMPVVDDDYVSGVTVGDHLAELTGRLGLASLVVSPMRGRAGTTGVIVLANQPGSRPFDNTDLEVVTDVGRRAALALDNARLHGRQSRAAEVLQRSLLTRLPEPDHVHLVARYLPASREAQVGGDWYDAFLQPDGSTVLVIGDVVGHDIAAAAAMGQVRTMLRSTAYDRGVGPAEVLSRVDAAMTGLLVDTLATVVVARIEQSPEDRRRGVRRLRWSNAGHPPPALARPDGTVVLLDADADPMLGVDHTVKRTEQETTLTENSVLLLYTDGLIERRTEDSLVGLARLRRALSARTDQPLDQVCDELIALMASDGSEDDVALIAARLYPEDRPRPYEAGPSRVAHDRPQVLR